MTLVLLGRDPVESDQAIPGHCDMPVSEASGTEQLSRKLAIGPVPESGPAFVVSGVEETRFAGLAIDTPKAGEMLLLVEGALKLFDQLVHFLACHDGTPFVCCPFASRPNRNTCEPSSTAHRGSPDRNPAITACATCRGVAASKISADVQRDPSERRCLSL
jgi:hypothetical protein